MVSVNKQEFIKLFDASSHLEVANLFDLLEATLEYGYQTFSTDFLTPNIWKKLPEKFYDVNVVCFGGFKNSDRCMVSFYKEGSESLPFPMEMLKVTATSKFHTFRHKDFMGSILSCGIRREKFGDLIQVGSELFVPIVEEIESVISSQVTSIGHSPCKVEKVAIESVYTLENRYKESICIVSSLRIDAFVAELTNLSREKSVSLIETGQVMVDYEVVKSKSNEVSESTTLTIRHYGKFKFETIIGKTGKERLKVRIKRYE